MLLGTTAVDLRLQDGRVVAVDTDQGPVDADVVVCAIDPRGLPSLAPHVARTMPAIPPVVCHLGLSGDVPDLPHEVVLHGDPTLVLRTNGTAPEGGAAWTVLGRGRLSEDITVALARRGIDVRRQVEVRVDRSPRDQVEELAGSAYGMLWQGRATIDRKLARPRRTPGCTASARTPRPGRDCRSWGCPRRSSRSGSAPPGGERSADRGAQAGVDLARGLGAVQRVEVQPRRAAGEQLVAELGGDRDALGAHGGRVALVSGDAGRPPRPGSRDRTARSSAGSAAGW